MLYEQLVGRDSGDSAPAVDRSNCSLTNIILEHIDLDRERQLKRQQREQILVEEHDEPIEEDEEEEDTMSQEEPQRLAEFAKLMHQSFLDGRDDFDYSVVDQNSDLDDLEIQEMDDQERYFDQDD